MEPGEYGENLDVVWIERAWDPFRCPACKLDLTFGPFHTKLQPVTFECPDCQHTFWVAREVS